MSDREIFERAIQEAIDRGWSVGDWTDADDFTWDVTTGEYEELLMHYTGLGDDWYLAPKLVLFDHDFAKALWGDYWAWFTEGQSGDTLPSGNYINWKGHVANMAVAEDPIQYLRENLPS